MGDLPELVKEYGEEFTKTFVKGMAKHGVPKDEAEELFHKFISTYSFNKGHATGYGLISLEEMYYKVYYPAEFWFSKLNQTDFDKNGRKYMAEAAEDGSIIFLPHVNYSVNFSLRKIDGEKVIQMGLTSIKGVGEKAALFIENERKSKGVFISYDNFYDRCIVKGSPVNKGVVAKLLNEGALEFNKKTYIKRVTMFNSTLYSQAK